MGREDPPKEAGEPRVREGVRPRRDRADWEREAVEPDDWDAPEEEDRPRPRLSRQTRLRILSATVVGALLITNLVFIALWLGARSESSRAAEFEAQRDDVVATAKDFMNALFNFRGATIDEDVARIESFAVGDFADELRTFFDETHRDELRKAEAVSVGQVNDAFIQSLEGQEATVFGTVTESLTNSAQPSPRIQFVLVKMDLIDTEAGWKVSRVDILKTTDSSSTLPGGPSSLPGTRTSSAPPGS